MALQNILLKENVNEAPVRNLSLLEKINSPADLKKLDRKDLPVLADEIRKIKNENEEVI